MVKPIQFSKCVFSIRCSYVLLDPARLKSSLGEKKYMVFNLMVRSQNSSHLSYVLLFFLSQRWRAQSQWLTCLLTGLRKTESRLIASQLWLNLSLGNSRFFNPSRNLKFSSFLQVFIFRFLHMKSRLWKKINSKDTLGNKKEVLILTSRI